MVTTPATELVVSDNLINAIKNARADRLVGLLGRLHPGDLGELVEGACRRSAEVLNVIEDGFQLYSGPAVYPEEYNTDDTESSEEDSEDDNSDDSIDGNEDAGSAERSNSRKADDASVYATCRRYGDEYDVQENRA
jgi:hypothetical protein